MESPLANRVFLLPHQSAVGFYVCTRALVSVFTVCVRMCWNPTLGHTSTCRVGDRTDDSDLVSRLGLTSEISLLADLTLRWIPQSVVRGTNINCNSVAVNYVCRVKKTFHI